jgi:carbon monoxide dehydrogenase subunit G
LRRAAQWPIVATSLDVRFEKTVDVQVGVEKAWEALLDPARMSACVPGVERVERVDDAHYVVWLAVKLGVMRMKFKMNVTLKDVDPPRSLTSVSVGEDASVAGSVRVSNVIALSPLAPNETRLSVTSDADVFGAIGTFGYAVFKGKADRMWDEFAANLKTTIERGGS